MNDVVTWLQAQLDGSERVAPGVHLFGCNRLVDDNPHDPPCNCGYPARLAADIAAKRRIIDGMLLRAEQGQQPDGEVFGYHATGMLTAIRLLAEVYADRPGYREEWRP